MSAPDKTLIERLPRQLAGGSDVVHVPGAAEEQWRLWVAGEAFPRIVLDVFGAAVLVGPGTVPPTPLGGGGGFAPSSASFITLAAEAGLSNESQLGTVIRRDVIANRGAFGNAGVIFISTDTLIGYRDSGTSWDPAFPVLNGSGQIAGGVLPNTAVTPGSYGDSVNGMKFAAFTVGADGRLTAASTVSIPRIIQVAVTDPAASSSPGASAAFVRINSLLNGGKITAVAAQVNVAGGGLASVQIVNVTAAVNVLSTPVSIDAGGLDSSTATTPAVINGANNTVHTADELRLDVTGAVRGLIVEITVTP